MDNPNFSNPGLSPRVRVAAANTASDGSGTINRLLLADNATEFEGGANGSRIELIGLVNSQATAAASSAMVIRIFISDNTGSNWRLLDEVTLGAVTRSTTVAGATGKFSLGGFDIEEGVKVGVVQSIYAGVQDQIDYIGSISHY